MKTASLVLAIAATACQGTPPEKPAKPLDANDPKSLAEHLAFNTRTQKSYETAWKARIAAPKGDPIDYAGRVVWVNPGVLYITYKATGGDEKNIVRAGKEVWVHHPLVGWVTSEEMGMPGAGRGIQNPDEILSVLARHLGGARLKAPGVVQLIFEGGDIEKVMKEQAQGGGFDWKESKATIDLHADAEHRLRKFTCAAELRSSDPNVTGTVQYAAEVEVTGYTGAREIKFLDEQRKEIPLTGEMKKAIETLQKEKK